MKRLIIVISILLFFGGGVLSLFWFGHYFSVYTFSKQCLSLEKPAPQSLLLGTQTVLDLRGTGFNRETSISLFMDVHNREAVTGSFPLKGVFNESLLDGDFLYLASDEGGLQVLNIEKPQQPQLLEEYLDGRSIIDIHRNGNYLFLSCGKSGVSIMLIQKNGLLNHIADISLGSTARKCLFIDGFLYIAAGSKGVLIYDAQQLEQVELVQIIKSGSFITNMAVVDDYLYLAVAERLIEIYQLTEPLLPLRIGSLELPENIFDLVIHQKKLCVATHGGVSMYSLTPADHPELLNQWTDFGSAIKIFSGSEHIYVSDSFSGLRVIELLGDSSPGYIDLNIDPRTIAETSDYLFVAGSNKGLLIIDKKALLTRQVVKTINTSGSARDLYIKNRWLYIADEQGGVSLQNLDSDGGVTTISARKGKSFTVSRDLLFVAEGKQGIEAFDVSNPGHPVAIVDWPSLPSLRLAIIDDYLLSANGISGVELLDISNIHHPVRKDILTDIHALDIISEDQLIFIASRNEGLLIYEITDDSKLNRLSQLSTPFPMNQFDLAVAVQVHDGIAYVANGHSGLLIVDVTTPRQPTILSSIAIPGVCKQVRVVDGKVFITSHHGGIHIVNVKNPKKPILLNSIPMPGLSRGLQVVDDLVYVTHNAVGVTVVAVPVMAEKIELLSAHQIQVTLPSPNFSGRYSLQISNERELISSDGVITYH